MCLSIEPQYLAFMHLLHPYDNDMFLDVLVQEKVMAESS